MERKAMRLNRDYGELWREAQRLVDGRRVSKRVDGNLRKYGRITGLNFSITRPDHLHVTVAWDDGQSTEENPRQLEEE